MEVCRWWFAMWDVEIRDNRCGGYRKWHYCDVDGLSIVHDEGRGACLIHCGLRKGVEWVVKGH